MTMQEIDEQLEACEESALKCDGFDDAVLGVVRDMNAPVRLAYSVKAMVAVLVTRDGMGEGEAREFLDFNTFGAYVGPQTPVFVQDE